MCEHKFTYEGIRYAHGAYNRPGGGAKNRYYSRIYFCEKCLEIKSQPISGIDENSYQPIQFNATPGTKQECGVPLEDQERW